MDITYQLSVFEVDEEQSKLHSTTSPISTIGREREGNRIYWIKHNHRREQFTPSGSCFVLCLITVLGAVFFRDHPPSTMMMMMIDDDNDRQFCLWLFISELVVVSYSDCGGI